VDDDSTKLDAEKRLALQEEKQALEAKLLDVYVAFPCVHVSLRAM
jgi:hypothetical protein